VRLRPDDPTLKVPHVGWNRVAKHGDDPMLRGIADGAFVYFVHSFRAVPEQPALLTTQHGDPIAAAVRHDNLFACQFHPEKSQAIGLRLLENFVS
jgi:glutamine amidotransferase